MANALHRTTKKYLTSVSPRSNYPTIDWILDPDVSAVADEPTRYWVITGDVVTVASASQKLTIDSAIAADQVRLEKDTAKSATDNDRRFLGFMKVMVDEINILRQALSIPPSRSLDDYKTATKTNIDGQS